jgi:uncharacterized protein with HEPN domain
VARRLSRPLLADMKAYAEEALEFLGERDGDALAADRLRLLALARAAEVVGEAASQVPQGVREQLPDVEFASAIAMRHRLIHGYGSLSARILADTIRDDFPRLIRALVSALSTKLPDE